ncbi:MAG: hypothetical protein GXZ03_00725 [Proteiniphilum sp.]|nr:hypothetical protein [Proteiniphilum sp.]
MSIKGGGCINKLDNDYLGQVTNFSDDDAPVQNLVQIKTENEQRLKSNISLLHTYLEKYDFKQILTYLFTREIELTSNIENVFTDEPLITNYIADIYLSTRAKSLNESPSTVVIKEVVNLIQEIYLHLTMIDTISSPLMELAKEVKIDNLLVERSLYYDIYTDIYAQLFNPISEAFYTANGFHLELIFYLHKALLSFMQEQIYKSQKGVKWSFDFSIEDIISFFKDDYANEVSNLIEYLSISTSDNSDLLPRFDNPIKEKPIIKNDSRYFCPNPDNILRYNKEIIENLLRADKGLWDRYLRVKGKTVEIMVVNRLSRILPSAIVGKNLKYKIQDTQYELDALFHLDSYILFVEVKSGNLTQAAREGNKKRLKRDIQGIVLDAHDQCSRAYKYYLSMDYVDFHSKNEKITVSKKEQKDAYLLSISLDNLDTITANIQKITDQNSPLNVITMSLYDLSIVTDILNDPSELFLYLDRRQKIIRQGTVNAHDEIDLFSTFLSQGLRFDNYKECDLIDITDFSNSLDIYYIKKLDEKKKPKLYANPFILKLVEELLQINKPGWLEVVKTLKGFSKQTQQMVAKNVIRVLQRGRNKGESDFSILPKDSEIGLTFYSCDELLDSRRRKMYAFILKKKQERSVRKWILLINIARSTNLVTDFLIC